MCDKHGVVPVMLEHAPAATLRHALRILVGWFMVNKADSHGWSLMEQGQNLLNYPGLPLPPDEVLTALKQQAKETGQPVVTAKQRKGDHPIWTAITEAPFNAPIAESEQPVITVQQLCEQIPFVLPVSDWRDACSSAHGPTFLPSDNGEKNPRSRKKKAAKS
jgi:hypothetical protein